MLRILEFLQWNTPSLAGEFSDILSSEATQTDQAHCSCTTPSWAGSISQAQANLGSHKSRVLPSPALDKRAEGMGMLMSQPARLTSLCFFTWITAQHTTTEVWCTGLSISMGERHKGTIAFVITMSLVLGNALIFLTVLQWQFLKGSVCLILSNLLVFKQSRGCLL